MSRGSLRDWVFFPTLSGVSSSSYKMCIISSIGNLKSTLSLSHTLYCRPVGLLSKIPVNASSHGHVSSNYTTGDLNYIGKCMSIPSRLFLHTIMQTNITTVSSLYQGWIHEIKLCNDLLINDVNAIPSCLFLAHTVKLAL